MLESLQDHLIQLYITIKLINVIKDYSDQIRSDFILFENFYTVSILSCIFWTNSILFQGFKNWFWNSILFQYFNISWECMLSYISLNIWLVLCGTVLFFKNFSGFVVGLEYLLVFLSKQISFLFSKIHLNGKFL